MYTHVDRSWVNYAFNIDYCYSKKLQMNENIPTIYFQNQLEI